MKLRLTNFADFGTEITEKDYAEIRAEGTGFVLETTVNDYTETYVAKTENACKAHFTRTYGKGAKWEEVKEEGQEDLFSGDEGKEEEPKSEKKRGRGRPKKEDKKKPAAKKKAPAKKEEIKKKEPAKEKESKAEEPAEKEEPEVGTFAIEGQGATEATHAGGGDNPEVGTFEVEGEAEGGLDMGEFETEPTEAEKEAEDIKKVQEGKKEITSTISPVQTEDPTGMIEFQSQAEGLTNITKAIVVIESDAENEAAREAAKNLNELKKTIDKRRKEINKPLQDNISDNNKAAKVIVKPMDAEEVY
jgi:hypothetical protein